MGILDKIKEFFQTREKSKDAGDAMKKAKEAASMNNFNLASIHAFYALETMGEVYANQIREDHQTAREYATQLTEEGYSTEDEMEPIIVGFEVAKYSEMQVSSDDYANIERSLDTVAKKIKSGRATPTQSKTKSRRRRPRRGGKTGAARSERNRPRFRRKSD